jgi:hypothetical protein
VLSAYVIARASATILLPPLLAQSEQYLKNSQHC